MPSQEDRAAAIRELVDGRFRRFAMSYQDGTGTLKPSESFATGLLRRKPKPYRGRPRYVIHEPGATWSLYLTECPDGSYDISTGRSDVR